jgi:PAS domain S-box-containing protein
MNSPEPASFDCRSAAASDRTPADQPGPGSKSALRRLPLRVLIVEDSQNDALLMEIELQRAGYDPVCERVETREAMSEALARQAWELVIADYVMPRFNGLEALALVKARGLDLPFIIVSGHITDDTAVAAMKAGAHDYVMKDNLARLGPAVERELREAEGRRARRTADQKLCVEEVFREAIEKSVPAGITAVDLEGRQTYVNPAFCAMVDWKPEELIGARPPFVYWPPEQVSSIAADLEKLIKGEAPAGGLELRYCRRTGERVSVLVQVTSLKNAFGNITGWVSSTSDITERKQAEARLAAEHSITRLLASSASLDEAAPGVLQVLLEALEVDLGQFWVPTGGKESFRRLAVRTRNDSVELRAFMDASPEAGFNSLTGLSDRVRRGGRAIWISRLSADPDFLRHGPTTRAGLKSAMAFPIQNDGKFLGAIEFFAGRTLEQNEVWLNMMTAIGSEIGQFTQRRNAEEELRRAHDELEARVQRRTAELKATNAKLQAAISERKRLENELLEITEKERRRIALDLHDDLGQRLSGIALMTKGLELRLKKEKVEIAQDASRINTLVQEAMTHASDLAHDLATLDLQQKTLPQALNDLAAHAHELFGISCQFSHRGFVPALDANALTQLYKIAQEALTNAIKHGKAKHVRITLAAKDENLVLTIDNDGVPFPDLQGRSTGMGLRIMNYRANLISGVLQIRAKGSQGTLVTCCVPTETKR